MLRGKSMNIQDNYKRWLNSSKVNNVIKEQLKKMSEEEKADAFYKNVEFGTAGMRGILGPGTNRLNEFTVRKATVGFAIYLLEKFPQATTQGVVISHDNRHQSREFTILSAKTLNNFGIKTYVFDSLRPTPELSFAVRYLKAVGGIMITASHNPKEYNGYKVYDETGCQLIPSKIKRLVEIINDLPNELDVVYTPVSNPGETIVLDKSIDDEYVKLVEQISLNPKLNKKNFKIVFTPNHGTSYVNAMRIFKDFKYDVVPVISQCNPDPDFSNTLSPNPEDPRSFIEPIKVAKENNADLIVMTDPDGDRVGLAYLGKDKEYHLVNGNEGAAMLLNYILTMRKEKKDLPQKGVMYNTVVTSPLGEKIASSFGVATESFLTGFKYIGSRIDYYEKHQGPTFVFGYEESYGCLVAPFARDKDGLQAILLYTEMALYYKLKGMDLEDVYNMISKRYGYHEDIVKSFEFKGPIGQQKMDDLMKQLREHPLEKLDGHTVMAVEDYLNSTRISNGETTSIELDKSNVMKFIFDDGGYIAIRPSGTEPKVKFYLGAVTKSKLDSQSRIERMYIELLKLLNLEQ